MVFVTAARVAEGRCEMVARRELLKDRIVLNPAILVGKPVVRGTRIPVYLVLERLADDFDLDSLFADYPRLTLEDVQACLAYAAALVAGEDIFPTFITDATAAD
jgi:uncharacterized protein (DUF433 family)